MTLAACGILHGKSFALSGRLLMPATVAEFLETARECGVLPADVAERYATGCGDTDDASAVARRLVSDGHLTLLQARCVALGKAEALFLGPYVMLEVIGRGGMGRVYKARHRSMNRVVAIKVMAKAAPGTAAIRRFEREVQASARLQHPNIVTAFDAGESAGVPYLVMQFVDGRNLAEIVAQEGPRPVGEAVDWVLQAARGLAHAHEQGVTHRDVKPSNLLLDRDGTVRILDMGVARMESPGVNEDQRTATGQIMGTIDYMAPEQALDGRRADARSDIYSLGATLWHLLTGRPLFTGESAMIRMLAHVNAPAPRLGDVRDDVPPALDEVFRRMVEKRPERRFPSMHEVVAALQSLQPRLTEGRPRPFISRMGRRLRVWQLAVVGGTAAVLAGMALVRWIANAAPAVAPAPAVRPFDPEAARRQQEELAASLGVDVVMTNSIGAELVLIPPGVVRLLPHDMRALGTVTHPFRIGQTEVTRAQWRAVMETEPWKAVVKMIGSDDMPASRVSWSDAVSFCQRLTEIERGSERISPTQRYRLPTTWEWEHACRAGTSTRFFFGENDRSLGDYAWHGGGYDGTGRHVPLPGGNTDTEAFAHAVRLKRPNPWGLFDVYGNVWEWCEDGQNDSGPFFARGGCWRNSPDHCNSVSASNVKSSMAPYEVIGFRLVLDLGQQGE